MKPDASATRARIVSAARAEFAAHGLAGARVDRIAVAAKASKERLYAYFGDKDALFGAVVEDGFTTFVASTPFDVEHLGASAAAEYLHFTKNPQGHRLLLWALLQQSDHTYASGTAVDTVIAGRRADIEAAQRAGIISDAFSAKDLMTMLFGIVSGWMTTPGADNSVVDDTEIRRRATVIESAVDRLCAP